MMHAGDPNDFDWDVVVGTSVGAINASIVGAWPKERGVPMSEDIFKHWSNLRTCDVYEPWKDKETHFSKYNAKNLENYMRRRIKEAFDPEHGYYRRTSVGLVDLPLMTYKRVDLDKIPRARVVE